MFYNLLFYISKYHFEKSKTYSAGAYIHVYYINIIKIGIRHSSAVALF